MDFLGNISLKLVGVLCTLAIMAGGYFFFLKPVLDTTSDSIDAFSDPINQALEQSEQAQDAANDLEDQADDGDKGAQVNLNKLQNCVQNAGQNVGRLNACANKFGP